MQIYFKTRSISSHTHRRIICRVSCYTDTLNLYKCFFFVRMFVCLYIHSLRHSWLARKGIVHSISLVCFGRAWCPPLRLPPYISNQHTPPFSSNYVRTFAPTTLKLYTNNPKTFMKVCMQKKNFDTFATFRVYRPLKVILLHDATASK